MGALQPRDYLNSYLLIAMIVDRCSASVYTIKIYEIVPSFTAFKLTAANRSVSIYSGAVRHHCLRRCIGASHSPGRLRNVLQAD